MAKHSMKGVVEILLDGAKRMVKFDFNAICELEDYFGKPAQNIFDVERGIALREIRGTLWIGLQRFHEGIKLNTTGDWIQGAMEEGRFEEVSGQLGEALQLALGALNGPDKKAGPGKNPEPPKTGAKKSKASTSQSSSNKPDDSE